MSKNKEPHGSGKKPKRNGHLHEPGGRNTETAPERGQGATSEPKGTSKSTKTPRIYPDLSALKRVKSSASLNELRQWEVVASKYIGKANKLYPTLGARMATYEQRNYSSDSDDEIGNDYEQYCRDRVELSVGDISSKIEEDTGMEDYEQYCRDRDGVSHGSVSEVSIDSVDTINTHKPWPRDFVNPEDKSLISGSYKKKVYRKVGSFRVNLTRPYHWWRARQISRATKALGSVVEGRVGTKSVPPITIATIQVPTDNAFGVLEDMCPDSPEGADDSDNTKRKVTFDTNPPRVAKYRTMEIQTETNDADTSADLDEFVKVKPANRKVINKMVRSSKAMFSYKRLFYHLRTMHFMKPRDVSLINTMISDARFWLMKTDKRTCDTAEDYHILASAVMGAFNVSEEELEFRQWLKKTSSNRKYLNATMRGDLGKTSLIDRMRMGVSEALELNASAPHTMIDTTSTTY